MKQNQITEALMKLILTLTDGIDAVSAFTQEQTPVILKQILTYELSASLILLVLGGCLLGGCIWVIKNKYSQSKKAAQKHNHTWAYQQDDELSDMGAVVIFLLGIGIIISIITILINFFNVFMIFIAPKLFLLEYAKNCSLIT